MSSVAAALASLMLFVQSIFSFAGGGLPDAPPIAHTQPAAVASISNDFNTVPDPFTATSSARGNSSPSGGGVSSGTSASTPPSQTIINNPVIERTIERIIPSQDAVSSFALATLLANLRSELLSRISTVPAQSGGGASVPSYANTFGLSQKIDSLTNTAINTPTITGGSISGATISGALSGTFSGTSSFTEATTTNLTVSSIQSSLITTSATGIASAYAGSSCTNQFVRSLNGAGIATCASVSLTADVTGTLAVANGGTGQTSFGQGWLNSNGTTLSASTSPTVNYITATSTTGTNFFAGFVNTSGTTGGYKIDGNLILQASSTNFSIAVGQGALNTSFTGTNGTAIGYQALTALTSGGSNTALGYQALTALTSAANNTAAGYQAMGNAVTNGNNTAFGYQALLGGLGTFTGTDNAAFGIQALRKITSGTNDVGVGELALGNLTSGSRNVAVGNNTLSTLTTASDNVAIGDLALTSSTASFNVAIGSSALSLDTTGNNNFASGYFALANNTTGTANIAIGGEASRYNGSATNTVAIGAASAGTITAGHPVFNAQGYTILGYQSGGNIGTGANYNTLLGYQSGYDITTGANNTILGTQQTTGNSITTGSNNILIGQGVRAGLSQTGSNQLNIGNLIFGTGLAADATLSTGNVGIGTTSPSRILTAFSSSAPQLSLSAGAGSNEWTFRNAGGVLYIATSTYSATSSVSAFTLDASGNLTIVGSATTCTIGNGTLATNCSSSDERLKDDIASMATSSGLAAINALNPVSFHWNPWMQSMGNASSTQFGLIAQQVQSVFPNLVQEDPNTHYYKLDYQGLIAPIVKAIQEIASVSGAFKDALITWLGDAGNGIDKLFAKEIYATNGDFNRVVADELCARKSDGVVVCITGDQLAAAVGGAASGDEGAGGDTSSGGVTSGTSTPPVIEINGANPAAIHIGDTYADLGARITGPQTALNLGILTYLDGSLTDVFTFNLDTSTTSTHAIDYVVTDAFGQTATATRTVIVE